MNATTGLPDTCRLYLVNHKLETLSDIPGEIEEKGAYTLECTGRRRRRKWREDEKQEENETKEEEKEEN